jgi:predicted dinucleotide-binding enzyme
LPSSDPKRRAVVIGDDVDVKKQVAQFIDSLGFDAVDLGSLKQ